MTVFIVVGTQGGYSDSSTWIHSVHLSEVDAGAEAQRLEALQSEAKRRYAANPHPSSRNGYYDRYRTHAAQKEVCDAWLAAGGKTLWDIAKDLDTHPHATWYVEPHEVRP